MPKASAFTMRFPAACFSVVLLLCLRNCAAYPGIWVQKGLLGTPPGCDEHPQSLPQAGSRAPHREIVTGDTVLSMKLLALALGSAAVVGAGDCGASAESSNLGYACARMGDGGAMLHWTVGGNMPDNECTRAGLGGVPGKTTSGPNVFHMAVTSNAADSEALTPPSADWTQYKSVARVGSQTIVCFTCLLNEPNAVVSKSLNRRVLNVDWAEGDAPQLGLHDSHDGFVLDAPTGASADADDTRTSRIRTHGILMAIGWAGLLPLGTLFPRHRWALGSARAGGKEVWFWLHLLTQAAGFVTMLVGWALVWKWFGRDVGGGNTGKAHQIIGTIVFAMACLQVLAGLLFRPHSESRLRPTFNLAHLVLGRVVISLAYSNIWLGVILFHKFIGGMSSLAPWVVPIAVVMALIPLLDVLLTMYATAKHKPIGSATQPCIRSADCHASSRNSTPGASSAVSSENGAKPAGTAVLV